MVVERPVRRRCSVRPIVVEELLMKYLDAMQLARNGASVRRKNWSAGFSVMFEGKNCRFWFIIPLAAPTIWGARPEDVHATDWEVSP
jgi:hypothetical protein